MDSTRSGWWDQASGSTKIGTQVSRSEIVAWVDDGRPSGWSEAGKRRVGHHESGESDESWILGERVPLPKDATTLKAGAAKPPPAPAAKASPLGLIDVTEQTSFSYLPLKDAQWDDATNIFPELFRSSIGAINPDATADDIDRLLQEITLLLENEDLGKAFYERLTKTTGLKAIVRFLEAGIRKDIKSTSAIHNHSGRPEITVVNIQKFRDDPDVVRASDYNIHLQRVYFLDEVHRSYNPSGSFLANLNESDTQSRIAYGDATIGAMVICDSAAQAKMMAEIFAAKYARRPPPVAVEEPTTNSLKVAEDPVPYVFTPRPASSVQTHALKTEDDARISQNAQLLANPAYAEKMMARLIIEQLKNQHIFKVTSDDYPRSITYSTLQSCLEHFKMMADLRKATMGHITREHLEQSRIAIPPKEWMRWERMVVARWESGGEGEI